MSKVRMVQQLSGPRADGREWPPPGQILDGITEEEARDLTHTHPGSSHPIALPVMEERQVEVADAPEYPDVETAAVLVPPKRGPGRPPGSTSRPR